MHFTKEKNNGEKSTTKRLEHLKNTDFTKKGKATSEFMHIAYAFSSFFPWKDTQNKMQY